VELAGRGPGDGGRRREHQRRSNDVEAEDQVCGGRPTARLSLSLSLSWSPTQGKGEEEAAVQPSRASSTVAWATR
jgi:hypothetical protein